jgi:TonB family protein
MKIFPSLLLAAGLFIALSGPLPAAPGDSREENYGIGINQDTVLAFPFSMMVTGILNGEARIVISVDAAGKLIDTLVVGYTNMAFAESAVKALQQWSFEPSRVRGRPSASRADVLFIFKSDIGVMVESLPGTPDSSLLRDLRERYSYTASQLKDLDHIPTPLHVVPPAAVKTGLRGGKRTVTVEFYIDEAGKVRMPAIGREDPDDAYAAAAVAAVEQWQFEPPVRKGRRVLVLARQDFSFVPKP